MSVDYWRLTNLLLECVGAAYPQAVPADRPACGRSNFCAGQAVNPGTTVVVTRVPGSLVGPCSISRRPG
jgi:hypothetical protein